MKHYIAIEDKYDTDYSVRGPFTTLEQLSKETLKLCTCFDYRPDRDRFLHITLGNDGKLSIQETEPYKEEFNHESTRNQLESSGRRPRPSR